MKIYTKTGDRGETSLFGGKRVPKDSLRIESYGTVDELNSILGICRSFNTVKEVDGILNQIQNDLFILGSDLATPASSSTKNPRIQASDIERLEKHIDAIEPIVEPLKQFILPGGSRTAAFLHFARTVCRRAERLIVRLQREDTAVDNNIIVYLNRLSDLLFMIARWVNALSNTPETKWVGNPRKV